MMHHITGIKTYSSQTIASGIDGNEKISPLRKYEIGLV
jgi:hypothetical protein